MDFLKDLPIINGVYYLTDPDSLFEGNYLEVRQREGRVYEDDEVKQLPFAKKDDPHYSEWKLRARSTERVSGYFKKKNVKALKILDVGCGNGWFTAHLGQLKNVNVLGLDINKTELEQAVRVFEADNCRFAYSDLSKTDFKNERFHLITLNACVQYFPDLKSLLVRLISLLEKGGEIHIIDSPFYKKDDLAAAKARSHTYYRNLGFEAMSSHYFHHCWEELKAFPYSVLYQPHSIVRKVWGKFVRKDSPFPWICIHEVK